MPNSGLRNQFEKNFAWNPEPTGAGNAVESQAPRRAGYVDTPMTIDPADVVLEVTGVNRFLPLPEFQEPYFVYRDETVVEQGGRSDDGIGSDLAATAHSPYVLSPFSMRVLTLELPIETCSFSLIATKLAFVPRPLPSIKTPLFVETNTV